MSAVIRVGIAGYGNLGKGVDAALKQNPDMELVAVFTRRPPNVVKPLDDTVPVLPMDKVQDYQDKIDVMILCGGSAKDLPQQGPELAAMFNTIDSFDTHAKIPEYFSAVDNAARMSGHTGIISVGWDPGLFSLNRLIAEAVLPDGATYTFWGKGVSQGHSDAIRR
ncbi:MAG TPA: diaminopimelate dehydrogenase, partial [Candidatus Atribacteria bacterium]|nr:diaminopimelate dehydrogenase [Candidatus Atribacteria bacterium]